MHIDDTELIHKTGHGLYNNIQQAPFLVSAKHLTEKEHNDLIAYPAIGHKWLRYQKHYQSLEEYLRDLCSALSSISSQLMNTLLVKVQSPTSYSYMGMTFINYLQDEKTGYIPILSFILKNLFKSNGSQ